MQLPWSCERKPEQIDWDGLIAEALSRGRSVPEVTWIQPGEDAAMEVGALGSGTRLLLVGVGVGSCLALPWDS